MPSTSREPSRYIFFYKGLTESFAEIRFFFSSLSLFIIRGLSSSLKVSSSLKDYVLEYAEVTEPIFPFYLLLYSRLIASNSSLSFVLFGHGMGPSPSLTSGNLVNSAATFSTESSISLVQLTSL